MRIITAQRGDTADYFVSELKKYIMQMSRGWIVPETAFVDSVSKADITEGTIVLALLDELELDTSDLYDAYIEDIIDADITNGTGYIAGSNQRSILMGIYRYCYSLGCRYIRPGADGDYVPKADVMNHSFKLRKKADQPFRGECSEGAISYEHMRDTVYWLPKIGMNMYMIEGLVPYTYMHKWYGHVGNDKLRIKGQVTDYDMLEPYMDLLEKDIKRTGIQLHTLGHAWMFEKLGVRHECNAIEKEKLSKLTDEQKSYLAMVNGVRDSRGSTFYTQFCLSNPAARKLLVDFMVEYIQKRPHVDFVHAWLADSINNNCECEECQKMEPSDWYVLLLNELDAELTRLGFDNRIVFILYNETVRPPKKLRLNNPHRFILLAAIGLHYEKGYVNEEYTGEIPEYKLNDFHPAPNALRLKWHRDWKEMSDNIPSMIFEYRFYTDMYNDLGHMQVCRETHRDMKTLENVAFNGCMSDQTHRMYMPTALPLIMMGETLFDTSIDYDTLANEYFEGAFGKDGTLVREYLEKLSENLCPSNQRIGSKTGVEEAGFGDVEAEKCPWINNPYVTEKALKVPGILEEFRPTILKNIKTAEDEARRLSWRYLEYHYEICRRFAGVLIAGSKNDVDEARRIFEQEVLDYLCDHEMEFHNVFDLFLFRRAIGLKIGSRLPAYYD